jgi:hypothetical protein
LEHNFVLQMALHGIEISMPERPASLKINWPVTKNAGPYCLIDRILGK